MRQALRTGRLEIDLVKPGGVQWVAASLQRLELSASGDIVALYDRDAKLHRRIDRVALEQVSFTDPLTGLSGLVSVAGVGELIKALMVKWMIEDNPSAFYDGLADLVILDGANS